MRRSLELLRSEMSTVFGVTLLLGLASMVLIARTSADNSAKAGRVDTARVGSDSGGDNWMINGRDFEAGHFSPLSQINDQSVSNLGLAWYLDIDSAMGIVSEPIVVDGVAYVSAPQSKLYAVDAASGKLIWKFDPKVRLNQAINGSYSARTNAGVAVWEGKVYVGTGDCRLVAVDAASGNKLWESPVCDATETGITGAPHVAKGKVFMGYNGSDDGVRGSLAAYDAESGKEVWRFWTVPGDPTKPFETKALAMAAQTWPGRDSWRIGGGDVWNAITYDPVTDFVIFGTAGAGVDYGELSSIRPKGDKLFAGCILAVKADSGEYVWHYQTSAPGLQTENNHIVMADLTIDGDKRHVAMTVPKQGFFYVLDARTGKLLSAKPIVKVNWAGSVDLRTGKAVEVPKSAGGGKQWTVHNWWPMSYNPITHLVYIPTYDDVARPNGYQNQATGRLIAWDPIAEAARWTIPQPLSTNSGVLSTAGNLVFQGQGTGEFDAYSADRGEKLWTIKTGSAIDSVPVSYMVGNDQYVLMPVGLGSASRIFGPVSTMATPESKLGPSRLLAFKLGATMPFPYPHVTIPQVPRPPDQTADNATIKRGQEVFNKFI